MKKLTLEQKNELLLGLIRLPCFQINLAPMGADLQLILDHSAVMLRDVEKLIESLSEESNEESN